MSTIQREERPAQPIASYDNVCIHEQPTLFLLAGQVHKKLTLREWSSVVTVVSLAPHVEHPPSREWDCAGCGS